MEKKMVLFLSFSYFKAFSLLISGVISEVTSKLNQIFISMLTVHL